jgi:endonuclease/exonuclease/phosphatase family metal-dependent hydrolase
MPQLTVITINCLGLPVTLPGVRRRLQALGRALAVAGADIACLQEVGRWRYLPLLLHESWPYSVAQEHPYAPRGGLTTLSQLPIAATTYTTFHVRGVAAGLHAAERYQAKGVLGVELELEGRPVVVLNTHLAANYFANWTLTNPFAKLERGQLREIAALVDALPADTLVVVAGDFNVPRDNWMFLEFLHAARLHDPLAGSAKPTYRPMPGMPNRAMQALDHVLVRIPPGIELELSADVCFGEPVLLAHGEQGYLSDHLGVRAVLRW